MFIRKFLISVWEVVEVLSVALASVFIIYGFIAQPFKVQGASMEPNFSEGNYLVVDELTYRFRNPERGEVVVFHNPANEEEFYIKRIIGKPHEKIEISGDKVRINGNLLEESYLPQYFGLNDSISFQLDDDEYFVMGDNRPRSSDSRRWGPAERREIVGVVRLRFWPLKDFDFFTTPLPQ